MRHMGFKTDNGGTAVSLKDAKLMDSYSSTWNTRLSQIGRIGGSVVICTQRIRNPEYIQRIFSKRGQVWREKYGDDPRIRVIASEAVGFSSLFEDVRIVIKSGISGTIVLVYPETVIISSQDFGRYEKVPRFDTTLGMHNKIAYKYYYDCLKRYLKCAAL